LDLIDPDMGCELRLNMPNDFKIKGPSSALPLAVAFWFLGDIASARSVDAP
jgi:hypothetical protein